VWSPPLSPSRRPPIKNAKTFPILLPSSPSFPPFRSQSTGLTRSAPFSHSLWTLGPPGLFLYFSVLSSEDLPFRQLLGITFFFTARAFPALPSLRPNASGRSDRRPIRRLPLRAPRFSRVLSLKDRERCGLRYFLLLNGLQEQTGRPMPPATVTRDDFSHLDSFSLNEEAVPGLPR